MARKKSRKRDPALVPLSQEHRRALALCVRLARWKPESDEPASLLAEEVRFQTEEVLLPHFAREEEVLFPAAAPWVAGQEALLTELIEEHGALRALVEQMAEGSGAPSLEMVLKRFGATLEAHVRREEQVLFPLIESRVPDKKRAELGAGLAEATGSESDLSGRGTRGQS